MGVETELKMKVDSHERVRAALRASGAMGVGSVMEINRFFDKPDRALLAEDRGLRIRTNAGSEQTTHIVTYKGPREKGPMKRREEIEFSVDDPQAAAQVLTALGYQLVLAFEKRRESWELGGCKVELDEVPHLGTFVEIEGADEKSIAAVQKMLRLEESASIADSYIALLMAWREQNNIAHREIRF